MIGVFLLSALVAAAQVPPQQAALLRAVLIDRDTAARGELSVRAADNQVVRYRFDLKTYVEDDERMIDVAHLRPGARLEVLSDLLSGSPVRYARTIHVVYPPAPRRIAARPRSGIEPAPDPFLRPDDLTYSGVVTHFNNGTLVLHTRTAGEQTFLLRNDTRFLADGETVAAIDLKPNMRVFVRAGKNGDGRLEVYRVMWGGILIPH